MSKTCLNPEHSELGKKSTYEFHYNPDRLLPITRVQNRLALGINTLPLPFYGFDRWNHYEVSWLNEKGKPIIAVAEIIYGCESENIIESKSMKLYFNSFNNSKFKDATQVENIIKQDLETRIGNSMVTVKITAASDFNSENILPKLEGFQLDELDVDCSVYSNDPHFLSTETEVVTETLYSDLLKSNCLVTSQPDWCSVQITYKGKKINRAGLLRYIVSFRNDNEFHEQCIEKIFMHVMQKCQPEKLTVYGRSTRRGGIDINSIRSTEPVNQESVANIRLIRQ